MKKISYLIATFFGAGRLPKAPGTFASLVSLILWAPVTLWAVPHDLRLCMIAIVSTAGLLATHYCLNMFSSQDPKEIVIDEVAGQGLALLLCSPNIVSIILGFLLFRLFDILKPWPINFAEKQLSGALGVMFDDLLAGVYALATLFFIERYFGGYLSELALW